MNVGAFVRSVRHTRPTQLAHRARLMLKRKLLERLASPRSSSPRAGEPVALADRAPQPIFRPRQRLIARNGDRLTVHLAVARRELAFPIDWHPPELEKGTRLDKLHLHYMEWLEALDDELFERAATDWIERVPCYGRGYWRAPWNSYALSIRCVVWMQELARRGPRIGAATRALAHRSVVEQMRFLESNLELDIGGNHLIKNVKALLWAGAYFDGPSALRWRRKGEKLLELELDRQVLGDGVHFELSPAYHAQVLGDLLECARVLAQGSLRDRLLWRVDSMARALAELTHPDGRVSQFGDGGLHMGHRVKELLAEHERIVGERAVSRRVIELADAGFFGLRDGANYVLIKCGALAPDHLPAHGHGDALAFEWSVGGKRLIVDAGVFEYDAGPRRAYSRSTVAHNAPTLDDRDCAEFHGSFRIGRRPRVALERFERVGNGIVVEGSHDGYAHLAGSPRIFRRITTDAASLRVHDFFDGGRGQVARARLLLHPAATIGRVGRRLEIRRGDNTATLDSAFDVQVVEATWCPDFGVSHRTRQVVITYGRAPCSGSFGLLARERSATDRARAPAALIADR